MNAFLKQTAEFCLGQQGLDRTLFIFPNRRSMIFFRKYLCDAPQRSNRVTLLPRMTTVSDFYEKVSGKVPSDRTGLLLKVYECYKSFKTDAESFDDFIYWGGVILSDFDDVDKYLVDARSLFINISNLSEIRDNYSYANDRQKAAIERLGIHFIGEGWSKRGDKDAKKEFLTIWNLLYPLYVKLHESLDKDGLAYSGMIYREIAQKAKSGELMEMLEKAWPEVEKFAFVGLNAISESERVTMKKMKDALKADFYWDYGCGMFIGENAVVNELMERNVRDFPGRFTPKAEGIPNFHAVSVPSSTGQAKLLKTILSSVDPSERGLDFAIVLSDETMLSTVLGEIPGSVGNVNVTMGYPLKSSEWVAFMKDVMNLQLNLRRGRADGIPRFYHKFVRDVLSSGIIRSVMDGEEMERTDRVLKKNEVYIQGSEFGDDGLPGTLFTPVLSAPATGKAACEALADYLLTLTEEMAGRLPEGGNLQKEFALMYWKCVNRLKGMGLDVLPKTWASLLDQLVAGESVPFEGEPLSGMQVMGPLETRALDFRHIVILNANEGVFPRRSFRESFIPPVLREGFGLPTSRNQDAVWEYYFYRLISRAENVWMVWDSRTDGLVTGEESRFVGQLRYICSQKVNFRQVRAEARVESGGMEDGRQKTEEDVEAIRHATLSASSVESYIKCPMSFYYHIVRGLNAEEEVAESLDAGLMGTVCHDTLQALYTSAEAMRDDRPFDKRNDKGTWEPPHRIPLSYLKSWADDAEGIRRKVNSTICSKLHCQEVSGRDLVTAEIAVRYVRQVVKSDIRLLENAGVRELTIHGLEKNLSTEICGHRFTGFIDRIDSITDGSIRVVDYKTGSDRQKCLGPGTKASDIFKQGGDKAALQFFLYDRMLEDCGRFEGRRIVNSMYAMTDMFTAGVETYNSGDLPCDDIMNALSGTLTQMEDLEVPFKISGDSSSCRYCDFKVLCGKKGN